MSEGVDRPNFHLKKAWVMQVIWGNIYCHGPRQSVPHFGGKFFITAYKPSSNLTEVTKKAGWFLQGLGLGTQHGLLGLLRQKLMVPVQKSLQYQKNVLWFTLISQQPWITCAMSSPGTHFTHWGLCLHTQEGFLPFERGRAESANRAALNARGEKTALETGAAFQTAPAEKISSSN